MENIPKHYEEAESIQHGYDRWAEVYDHDANPLPALEEPLVRLAMGDVRDRRILDLGCGTGRHATWLAAAGAQVTGVDFSAKMLELARLKQVAGQIEYVQHDLHEPLPWNDPAFDGIVSGLVLEHLHDLNAFFGECSRMLRPQGRAVISAMHPAMFLRGSQARFTDPQTGRVVHAGSIPHSISQMIMAMMSSGLRLRHIEEHTPDAEFAAQYPRAEKYIGWPMVVVFTLSKCETS